MPSLFMIFSCYISCSVLKFSGIWWFPSALFGVETSKKTRTSVRTAVYVTSSDEHFIVSSLLSYCTVAALRTIILYWKAKNPTFNSLLPGWSLDKIEPCISSAWLGVLCEFDYSSNHSIIMVQVTVIGMWVTSTICNAFPLLSLNDSPGSWMWQ